MAVSPILAVYRTKQGNKKGNSMALKYSSFQTPSYRVAFDSYSGTFIVIRRSDDYCTLRYTGMEGIEEYTRLKRAYRRTTGEFDKLAALLTYHKGN